MTRLIYVAPLVQVDLRFLFTICQYSDPIIIIAGKERKKKNI